MATAMGLVLLVIGAMASGQHLQNINLQRPSACNINETTGGWATYPSEKYDFVNWDDDIPNIWKTCFKPPTR